MCGENGSISARASNAVGSSPRVRGKLSRSLFITLLPGLIPACAGKTPGQLATTHRERAHPRVCGENVMPIGKHCQLAGSSPRVRGKRTHSGPHGRRRGLIPACAGKTMSSGVVFTARWAHPRVCGENAIARAAGPGFEGSSPRVRGKH